MYTNLLDTHTWTRLLVWRTRNNEIREALLHRQSYTRAESRPSKRNNTV